LTAEGLIIIESRFEPAETAERLIAAVTSRGMAVMARVDHAAAAQSVGLALRPTEVLMFGNPRAGTPLMQAVQTIGIDLPLKVLIWQDEAGKTWLGYNDPKWIATRHGFGGNVGAIAGVLAAVAHEAAGEIGQEGATS
jgi:uncharacterized protein (DUF302 family)